MTYGYCRISTGKQNINRQERNIKAAYPQAVIIKETYTGTKLDRREWKKLTTAARAGDTIVFDSVSRMSRNAAEGFEVYEEMFENGIELIFLKEPLINTAVYREAIDRKLPDVQDEIAQIYIEATKRAMMILAKRQVITAFEQAEKEVNDLHQRTREGIQTAKINGKQIGGVKGRTLTTKKSIAAKAEILKHSRDFGGSLNDIECMKLVGLANNTYYKYKRELKSRQEE
jgi:DNA invertase Pin-like site-specific DNA recombinase